MSEDKKLSRRRSYHKHKDAINARQRAKRKADPSVLEKERARDAEIMYGKDFKQYIVRRKMKRCVDENVEWGLGNLEDSIAYLDWPEVCPVLGIKLNYTGRRDTNDPDTPSLDRRDNSKGYVRGNVRVISWRANSRKSDLTALELWQIYRYAKDGRGLFSKSPPKPEPMQWTEATPEEEAEITAKMAELGIALPPMEPMPEPEWDSKERAEWFEALARKYPRQ